MSTQRYRYAIALYRADGTLVEQVPVSVDWDPALEWAWLQGLRQSRLQLADGTGSSAIRPLWSADAGEPYLDGFRVTIYSEEGDGATEDFPTAYFNGLAKQVTAELLEKGRLTKEDQVRYLPVAFFDEGHANAGPVSPYKSREVPPNITFKESPLADFTERSCACGDAEQGEMPIVISQDILEETRELARTAGAKETGGVLIGHLHRDTERPEVFVEITAQVPAVHTISDVKHLTFTHETWSAARAAVDLRRSGEIFLGWWHSHPVREWCKDCPQEKRSVCPFAKGFLSAEDRHLHRTIFPRAFTCALTVNDVSEDEITHTLFGWQKGALERRGYYVPGGGAVFDAGGAEVTTDNEHQTPEGGIQDAAQCTSAREGNGTDTADSDG